MKRLAFLAMTAIPAIAFAHHGWSSYDANKTITHTAALTNVSWGNPHGSAKVRYQGKDWDVVLAPVARMEARGLTREMLAPKNKVTLVGYPRADGTPEMRIERVIAGGKTVELR
jgi:D-arabinose 1-dehydrogenase-like Zn-dependent alcohol dehydrogenase